MLKQLALLTVLAASMVSLNADEKELMLYTHRHYPSDDQLYAKFTEKTGIKIKVVKGDADQLIERIKAEGENSPADLYITADAGRLERAKSMGLLKPVDSEVLKARIPASLRDPSDQWFGFTKRARVIVYDKDRVKPEELSTYEDLADPKWKGRILVRSSSSVYNQSLMAAMIAAHDEAYATEWARAVSNNMARPPQGSDREQIRSVAAGLGDVAIVNTYYVGLLETSAAEADRNAAAKVGIFFPNQNDRGTHVNVSGGGVVKTSKNSQAAQQFLEFLVSDEVQEIFPKTSCEYPVVETVEWAPLQKNWGTFKADPLNVSTLGELNSEALRCFNRAGWK